MFGTTLHFCNRYCRFFSSKISLFLSLPFSAENISISWVFLFYLMDNDYNFFKVFDNSNTSVILESASVDFLSPWAVWTDCLRVWTRSFPFVVVPLSLQFSKHWFCGLGAPITCATQELLSQHRVYRGFSSQSLCWASLGLFLASTIPGWAQDFSSFTHRVGGPSSALGVPTLCADPRASFSLCLWPECQVSLQG